MNLERILSRGANIDLELSDVINVADVQSMMNNFYRFTKIPMAVLDNHGKALVSVGWQEICTRFHRIHPETQKNCVENDLNPIPGIPDGEFKLYKCKNGMWDMVTPVYAGIKQLGYLFLGQFFFEDESIDYDFFKSQAMKYDFDESEYMNALMKVPRLSRDDLESARSFLVTFTDSLSQTSLSNIRLIQSRSLLERSQEIALLGSWEFDLRNNKLFWTDEVYRIFGFTPGEYDITSELFLLSVHPDDRAMVNDAYQRSIRDNLNTYEIEHRIIMKNNGEVRYVHEKCDHFRDESNQIIRSVGMIHDITEQKKSEEILVKKQHQLQKAKKDLERSQEKLKIALDNGKIGIWEWDVIKDKLILDEKTEEMFGFEPGSYTGSYKTLEPLAHEEDITHIQNSFKNAFENDLPLETLFRIKTKTGETKYMSAKAIVRKNKGGKPITMSGVVFDMTDFKATSENLVLKLNEELLRSNNELERFAYVASHDLQEPLRMITSFTQLLAMQYGDKLDDRAKGYITFAVDGAKRMYELLNGLLDYSRIHSKGEAFDYVDLKSVLEKTLNILSLKIEERKAVISSDELPSVIADEGQMIHLFQNLISNSIKFSVESPRIHISSRSETCHYIISIRDQGMGIEPQYFNKIFHIFQRLMPKEEFDGTGIGLAICKRIVERHRGKIWVESEPGKGSIFYFTIPYRILR